MIDLLMPYDVESIEELIENVKQKTINSIISYLSDCQLIEDSLGCYECLNDLMENIEKIGVKNNE